MAFTSSAAMELRATGASVLNSGVFDSGVVSPGVDYTQQDNSQQNGTDLASTNGTTNPAVVTSAGYTFVANDVGNSICISAGTSWTNSIYIIVSVAGGAATLDKACGSAATLSSGTWRMGGAYPMGSATAGVGDSARVALLSSGNIVWIKNGTFNFASITAATSGTAASNIFYKGYNSSRGDSPTGANRPTINMGANSWGNASHFSFFDLIVTGTAVNVIFAAANSTYRNLSVTCTSASTGRTACLYNGSAVKGINCEFVSQNGFAITNNNTAGFVIGCYLHDSNIGVTHSSFSTYAFNIFENFITAAFTTASTVPFNYYLNNTFYGAESPVGEGIQTTGASAAGMTILNNIFYGLSKGIDIGTVASDENYGDYNTFFNNTTDRTNMATGPNSVTINPAFTNVSQITGTTATTAASVLTDSGKDFSTVTDNVSYLRVVSGTGVTTGIYLVTSHTTTTLTVNNALGTSSGGNVVYSVGINHNFLPTGNI